jgi:hypothetical protein
VFVCPNFVQAQHLARRVVKLIVVDLDMRKGSIELHVNVALPGGKSYVCHGKVGLVAIEAGIE